MGTKYRNDLVKSKGGGKNELKSTKKKKKDDKPKAQKFKGTSMEKDFKTTLLDRIL